MRRLAIGLALCLVIAAALRLAPARAAGDEEIRPVLVTNFPESQKVEGSVSIVGPLRQAALAHIPDIEVPPVKPDDPRRLVSAGVLTTDGFAAIVLSLAGSTKGRAPKPGEVGALLVPDEDPILRVLDEQGLLQFPLEVKAPVALNTVIFSSAQERRVVAFPRYRVLLYNTSDRTMTVDLFAYLTM
ncbi:MAG: hypothetical protein ACREAA_17570 [Candidatus Polarisedimenticolia bacterium]